MWGQSKISSCCISDWCKSREMRGRRSLRLPTPMVESFSADLLAIKSYWTESSFELCILLGEQDTKLLDIMPLLQEFGEKIDFLCVYVAETIIIVIINFIVYIVAVVVCQNRQVNRPSKCKHEISDSLHYSVFFILFCYTKLSTDPHVNKDFFLFDFLAKVVYHVQRQELHMFKQNPSILIFFLE